MLAVSELRVRLLHEGKAFDALAGVSLAVQRGESVALVGESGSGKSTLLLSLVRLLPEQAQVLGSVSFLGEEVLAMRPAALQRLRGRGIALVLPDASTALDPVRRVGAQIAEGLPAKTDRAARVEALLQKVELPASAARAFPHELSGGMRQRALLAAALASSPALLAADEPTSALDPLLSAQLSALLRDLRARDGLSVLVATHDLAFAAAVAERVAVLYAGRIVETGPTRAVLGRPRHPYTAGLLASLPAPLSGPRKARLEPLSGALPAPWELPSGCRFRDRCPRARADCATVDPVLSPSGPGEVACLHPL